MSENNKEINRIPGRSLNAGRNTPTIVWRKQSAPVGGVSSARSDARFVRRTLLCSLLVVLLLIALGCFAYQNISTIRQFYAGVLIDRGEYQQAEKLIQSLDDESAVAELMKRNYYECAVANENSGKLSEAISLYLAAGDYPGAKPAWQKAVYKQAKIYEADGDFQEASDTYASLGDYSDALDKSEECSYSYAFERYEYGYYEEAMRLFYALGSYQDAAEYAKLSAVALSENKGAGDLVALLVGLTDEQLDERARLKDVRESLPHNIIATGYLHTVALTEDGTVLAAGSNRSGQGNVTEWKSVTAVAAGAYHTVGLLSDGTVVACGSNQYGQCNVNGWDSVTAIYAGAYNTVGIQSDGTIINTGYASYQTMKWHDVMNLSIGDYALCGVMANGQPLTTADALIDDTYFDLVAIDVATATSAGLKADGTVVAIGLDTSNLTNIVSIDCTPNGLVTLDDTGHVASLFYRERDAFDFSGRDDVVAISASATHIVAVTKDGLVLAEGLNNRGQCNTDDWVLFTPDPEMTEPGDRPEKTPEP